MWYGVCVGVDEIDGDDGGKPGDDTPFHIEVGCSNGGGATPNGVKIGDDTPFHIEVGCSNGGDDTPVCHWNGVKWGDDTPMLFGLDDSVVLMVKDDRGPDNGNFWGGVGGVPQPSTQGDFSPGVTWCGWGNLVGWNGRRILEGGVDEIVGVILCGSV